MFNFVFLQVFSCTKCIEILFSKLTKVMLVMFCFGFHFNKSSLGRLLIIFSELVHYIIITFACYKLLQVLPRCIMLGFEWCSKLE